MKTLLLSTLFVIILATQVENVARRIKKKVDVDNENKNNGTRTVLKLNRPKWNQHNKMNPTIHPSMNPSNHPSMNPSNHPSMNPSNHPSMTIFNNPMFQNPQSNNDPSICQRREETTKPGEGFFFVLTCQLSNQLGTCTKIIGEGNITKIITTYYECCPGFERGLYSDTCDIKISDSNLRDAIIEDNRGEFVAAFDSFNLSSPYLVDHDGDHNGDHDGDYDGDRDGDHDGDRDGDQNCDKQFTIFVPTNDSLNQFKASLENTDEIENFVEITPDLVEKAKHIRGRLVSHVVPHLVRDAPYFGTLKLQTAHHDSVIFLKRHPPMPSSENEDKDISMSANCIPVTSTKRVRNGMIYNIDGFLQSSELSFNQLIEQRGDLTIFKSLLEKANVKIFDNKTTTTIVVPTDEAFKKDHVIMNKIQTLQPSCLKELVLNHVFHGFNCISSTSEMLNHLHHVEFIQREEGDDDVIKYKVGAADVTQADVVTRDGLIHVVDTVLVPSSILTVPELAREAGATKFADILKSLEFEPGSDNTFTIIIPTNKAIEEYNNKSNGGRMSDTDMVDYHTLVNATDILEKPIWQTVHEHNMIFDVQKNYLPWVLLAQCIPIQAIKRYHKACSYTAFFTNQVLEPSKGSLFELMERDKNYGKFVSIIKQSKMEDMFRSEAVTVFVLSNQDIEKLPSNVKNRLSKDQEYSKNFVLRHTFNGVHCLPEKTFQVRNRAGESMQFSKKQIGTTPLGRTNQVATNGVLHEVRGEIKLEFYQLFSTRFKPSFDMWHPFLRICWSDDDDEVCEEFKKK